MAQRPIPAPVIEPVTRGERVTTYMFFAILGLSVISLVALIIGGPTKSGAIWTTVALLPFVGLPVSFILIIVLLVLATRRRSRAAKVADK